MSQSKLVIGEKNLSAASLAPWLILRQLAVAFDEVVIPLSGAEADELIRRHAPGGRLPFLLAGEVQAWGELAIAEHLAEHFPHLWPASSPARAFARSVAGELHGGFAGLRAFMPLDVNARFEAPGRLLAGVAIDLRHLVELWAACRARFGGAGPFLFGEFTIPDALSASFCTRLATHGIPLDEATAGYVSHMLSLPAILEWAEDAGAESGVRAPLPRRDLPEALPAPAIEPLPAAPEAASPPPDLPAAPEPPPPPEPQEEVPLREIKAVIPQRAFGAPEEPDTTPRRMRPPGRGGLFRWRTPVADTEPEIAPVPEPSAESYAAEPIREFVPEPPAAEPDLPPEPQEPAPPAPSLPRWLVRPQPAPAKRPVAEAEPANAGFEEPPVPSGAPPLPAWLAPREPAVEPALPETGFPPGYAERPITRPGTIKPIGDGIRRRR